MTFDWHEGFDNFGEAVANLVWICLLVLLSFGLLIRVIFVIYCRVHTYPIPKSFQICLVVASVCTASFSLCVFLYILLGLISERPHGKNSCLEANFASIFIVIQRLVVYFFYLMRIVKLDQRTPKYTMENFPRWGWILGSVSCVAMVGSEIYFLADYSEHGCYTNSANSTLPGVVCDILISFCFTTVFVVKITKMAASSMAQVSTITASTTTETANANVNGQTTTTTAVTTNDDAVSSIGGGDTSARMVNYRMYYIAFKLSILFGLTFLSTIIAYCVIMANGDVVGSMAATDIFINTTCLLFSFRFMDKYFRAIGAFCGCAFCQKKLFGIEYLQTIHLLGNSEVAKATAQARALEMAEPISRDQN